MHLDRLPETRRSILRALKAEGPATLSKLAEALGISSEAVRQQLVHLERAGWVEHRLDRAAEEGKAGRPAAHYALTEAGDHLFPKGYDTLSIVLIDTIAAQLGPKALHGVLAEIAESRVRELAPKLEGLALADRLSALRALYAPEDPFMSVEPAEGGFRLIERNCPFLNTALRRPVLCSVSVHILTRLLGVKVVREERFQHGDGRCAFRVYEDRPVQKSAANFSPEPEPGIPAYQGP
jgi:predicted ArsR family transcriptional regulator